MKPAHDVKFRDRLGISGSCCFERFFERHGVGARRIFLAPEGAESACSYADVRGIDVAIDIEIRLIAVHSLANGVRHPSEGKDVPGAIKVERIGSIQALASANFLVDRRQAPIVRLEVVGLGRMLRSHPYDDIAGRRGSAMVVRWEGGWR